LRVWSPSPRGETMHGAGGGQGLNLGSGRRRALLREARRAVVTVASRDWIGFFMERIQRGEILMGFATMGIRRLTQYSPGEDRGASSLHSPRSSWPGLLGGQPDSPTRA